MASVVSSQVVESLFSSSNFGSIDEDCFTFLSHKDTKNKWKSHKIGKKCRNKQKQSNNNRNKKWKNLCAKRRCCNELMINSSIESDILNEEQSILEYELTETEITDKKLLILDSPKRRRRGSSKQYNKNHNHNRNNYNSAKSMSISPLSLSPIVDSIINNTNNNNNYDDDNSSSYGSYGGYNINPPARRRANPEKPKIIDQFPHFNIENELKELGLTEFAATMLTDDETNKNNNANNNNNNNNNSNNTEARKMRDEQKEKHDKRASILLKLEKEYKESIENIEEHGEYSSIDGLASYSTFKEYNKTDETTIMDPKRLKKVFKEIQTELPNNIVIQWNGSMFVRFDESNPRFMQALLTGLDDTPYHNGLFLFDIYLHKDYPNTPLNIKHVTKGGNLVYGNHTPGGFSPNLHRDSGKVCLSLLGTWGENQWDKDNSNVYQVLSSILFWILGAKWAYYMEPSYGGWELTAPMNESNFNKHKKDVIIYNYEIIEKCMKYAILETIKTPYNGFNDVIKCHFKCKKNEIFYTMLCKWIKNIDNINVENRINIKNKLIPLYYEIKKELLKL